ncbi:hypothetical protein POSPLADRAFT_1146643 [Postia placenta MAD-698-R-SB12]|uniref:CCHC-type domain-containing protein n=1 Tax=Postia placenta MAD-698-R-SB12 TaxID=670580 RepID=A0A1X6MWP8_9APHY|nr:hypothetical protein POSPLADRAFT_1146643 [Postia placenta MAD-698-R-SB12]OSX60781.1 hypothetical protein POSPLADRAFT_1146643 [Postia placenta MAD-698-R-SB12]
MTTPASPDKEVLKHLLPLRYNGKIVLECNHFVSQLQIYWAINTVLSTLELKVQVALALLDGDAYAWATPLFTQLAAITVGVQGATLPFSNEDDFFMKFKAQFSNLDDATATQVELTKVYDKLLHDKCTAAKFLALFKGLVDHSGYGDLELCDKYLSTIPSHIYHKIELEPFTTWAEAEERVLEVEQMLDISRARRPEVYNFFLARRGGAPSSHGTLVSINVAVGKEDFPGNCYGCGKEGYHHFECPNCKDKPYTKHTDMWATVASGSTQVMTSAPIASPSAGTIATLAKLEKSELADLMAQVKSMCEELEHYWVMKEESF